ncbi:MAG TPA: UdgX family uracil-DNA binding protein [Polyangiaceae bacterium]|nr:UdgX family uracil-DNA binding protein [Polyangiaceae bacterium]
MAASQARTAAPFLLHRSSLPALRAAAAGCEGCDLYRAATQTVFGEGPKSAGLVLIGEQPGDQEDRAGRPFVGPAGGVLDRALVEVGLERSAVYVTNAVKHFSFEPRGKARLHKKPKPGEVRACRPWLEAELAVIKPGMLVLLGSTAAQALLGAAFRVTKQRGKVVSTLLGIPAIATWHPSAILRAPDATARERLFRELVTDLSSAARAARAA